MRTFSAVLALAATASGVVGCDSDTTGVSSATDQSVAGLWNAPVPEAERSGDRRRNVLQFDPPAEPGGAARYAIFGEQLTPGGHLELGFKQAGTWHVEDAHVVFNTGSGPLTANEIFDFTGATLTLESGSSTEGRLVYERVDGCPDPVEAEGWSTTPRSALAGSEVASQPPGNDLAIDTTGRVHLLSGGGGTTYATQEGGCRWISYALDAVGQPARILVTPDDQLHVLAGAGAGFAHVTAPAAMAPTGAASWTAVAPGPMSASTPTIGEAAVDASGVLWVVSHAPELALYTFDGAWSLAGAVPHSRVYPPQDVQLNTDDAGVVYVIVPAQAGLPMRFEVFAASDLAAGPRVLEPPADADFGCTYFTDLFVDAAGSLHVACGNIATGQDGGYLTNAGGAWTLTPLPNAVPHAIAPDGAGVALVSDTLWRRAGDEWRAPGPALTHHLTGERSRVARSADGALHLVDPARYATHVGFPDSVRTTVDLTIDGESGGSVRSTDGQVSCTQTCSVEVAAGTLLRLEAVDGEATTFKAWSVDTSVGAGRTLDADGRLLLWATGDRVTATASFGAGGLGLEATRIGDVANAQIGVLDDGTMVVAGGFEAGFTPEDTALSPESGIVAPFAMGIDEDGELLWFDNYDSGGYSVSVTTVDVADADTAIFGHALADDGTLGGPTHTGPGYLVGGIDGATGAHRWSTVVTGTVLEMAARPGGGAAVMGTVVDGSSGVRLIDTTGEGVGVGLSPIPINKSGIYRDRTWLAAVGTDHVIVATTDANTFGSVHLVSDTGEVKWSSTVGGAPLFVAGSDTGGAWVVTSYTREDQLPDCAGGTTNRLLHFNVAGQCTKSVSTGVAGAGALRADASWASLGADGEGNLALVASGPEGLSNTFISVWPGGDGTRGLDLAWSPDGRRLAYVIEIFEDNAFGDAAVGWARFR